MLSMLRSKLNYPNVVATLALFIALGGSSYAVIKLPKASVGGKQLKKNAVTSPKVKPSSLLLSDFRASQRARLQGAKGDQGPQGDPGVPGPTFGAAAAGSTADPPATPDESSNSAAAGGRHFDFTLPASGRIYVRFYSNLWGVDCSAGGARFGLYLDGAPLPKTDRTLPIVANARPEESVVVTPAIAGPHSLEARRDCPTGSPEGSTLSTPSWTVLLLAG